MALREKVEDSAPRMEYLDIAEYAHKYEKLDRENVPLWISNFRSSIVKVLSGFSHIEEALALFITSDETNNSEDQADIKFMSVNSMMLLVLEKASENDEFMMKQILKEGNTWVNHLLRILTFNAKCSLKMREGETVNKFDERVTYTMTENRKNGTRTPPLSVFDMKIIRIKHALPTTYALVREIVLAPCMDISAATPGKKLMLKSPEINQ